ncbi:MAG: class I SAM-dependent methyltransferase [Pseudomonadota bacterium]|nr:class I SAM-dependent methyltransferase [Pseudomonadota bacterium]
MNPWTSFWRQGHSTAFGDSSEKAYDGAIRNWWLGILRANPAASTILEIACGNTSLLPGMIESHVGQVYIGVDVAEVTLSKAAQDLITTAECPSVELLSETPAENLPVPANNVDLAASVFGIEYSDENKSFAEVLRVLNPGAAFFGLLHHSASPISDITRRSLGEYDDEVMAIAIEALQTVDRALERCGNNPAQLKNDADAEAARMQINELAKRFLSDDATETNSKMFDFMKGVLFYFRVLRNSASERRKVIDHLFTEYHASRERAEQMLSVGRDELQMAELVVELKALGFSNCKFSPVSANNSVLAWQLQCEKLESN